LGRLSLLITLLTFAIFFFRLLKPDTGFLHSITKQKTQGLFVRYQRFWFYLSLTLIFSLIFLTITGYVYTAGNLTRILIYSIWFIFALIIVQQLFVRWLLIAQRRYALKVSYEKIRALRKTKESDKEDEQEQNNSISKPVEPEIDIVSLSSESKKLLNTLLFILGVSGLIMIWADVLPALRIFEKVELWHHVAVIDGTEKFIPITLNELGLAILIAIITFVAIKQLPSLIEIILLQTTQINSGNRYTIKTLISYIIIASGFFSVFNILGADWAQVQWLFTALSVGIGFGLQEIVANFISGLIILFERPIRVGDYVSVGENEGTVSRIKIRATTILTKDRKELLVPNKEFITGQLLNWSLSDPTTRVTIPVGVAYGSDVKMAKEILLDIAQKSEAIMDTPPPKVIFYNFGDNTLDLQLRCFVARLDNRLSTISDTNEIINNRFNDAGINIAFPQRDVHLDISQPIDINLKDCTK